MINGWFCFPAEYSLKAAQEVLCETQTITCFPESAKKYNVFVGNCRGIHSVLTCRVGLLPLHIQKLLPLVFGSYPLFPQKPAEQLGVRCSVLTCWKTHLLQDVRTEGYLSCKLHREAIKHVSALHLTIITYVSLSAPSFMILITQLMLLFDLSPIFIIFISVCLVLILNVHKASFRYLLCLSLHLQQDSHRSDLF